MKKDDLYYTTQEDKLQQILQQLHNKHDDYTNHKETTEKISQHLQSILHQNQEIQQNLHNINTNQGTSFQTICEIQQKLNTKHLTANQSQQLCPTGTNSQPPFVPYLNNLPGNSYNVPSSSTVYQPSFDYCLNENNQQATKMKPLGMDFLLFVP